MEKERLTEKMKRGISQNVRLINHARFQGVTDRV